MAALGRLAAITTMEEQTSRMQEMLARIVKVHQNGATVVGIEKSIRVSRSE